MPIVPRQQLPEVRNRPVEPVFQDIRGANAAAFGGAVGQGLVALGQGAQEAGDRFSQMAISQQIQDNERRAKELDIQMDEQRRKLLFGDGTPENPGYFSLRGSAAVDQGPAIQEQLNKILNDLVQNIKNPRVREMFTSSASQKLNTAFTQIGRHVINERITANNTASQARIQGAIDDAALGYNDPDIIAQSRAIIRGEIFNQGEIHGWEPEVVQQEMKKAIDAMVSSMVTSAIKRNDIQGAQAILDAHRTEMSPAIVADIEATLEEPKRLATAQTYVDQVMSAVETEGLSEQEALAQARADFDPGDPVRDEVVDRIKTRFSEKKRVEKAAINEIEAEVSSGILNGDFKLNEWIIDNPERWRVLAGDPSKVKSVKEAQRMQSEGRLYADEDDIATVDALNDMSSAELAEVDIPSLRTRLTEDTFERHRDRIQAARKAAEGDPNASAPYKRATQILKEQGATVAALEYDEVARKRSEEAKKLEQLIINDTRGWLESQFNQRGNYPADNEIARFIRDRLTPIQRGEEINLFFGLTTETFAGIDRATVAEALAELTPEERQEFRANLDDVRPELVEGAKAIFRENGITNPTDDQLEQYLGAWLLLDKDRQENLLGIQSAVSTGNHPFFGVDTQQLITERALNLRDRGETPPEAAAPSPEETQVQQGPPAPAGQIEVGPGEQEVPADVRFTPTPEAPATLTEAPADVGQEVVSPGEQRVPADIRFGPEGIVARNTLRPIRPQIEAEREQLRREANAKALREREATLLQEIFGKGDIDLAIIDFVTQNEGVENIAYTDTLGNPTIGVGFNLNRSDAREKIEALGLDFDQVVAGEQALTDEQVIQLLEQDLKTAKEDAKALVSNFDELNSDRQRAVIDLAFNMGRGTFGQFVNTIAAIEREDFETAANNLEKSLWFQQVGNRGPRVVSLIRGAETVEAE